MARPKKPETGSQAWARAELKTAEQRLKTVRRLIETADAGELPGLLRLEAALRRECERLARMAAPQVLTESWADAAALEELLGGEDDE